ncbi:MAG: FAD-binding oxidoreductase [Candidatus Micrarchaeota archaeon]
MEFISEVVEIRDYRDEDKVQMRTVKVRLAPDAKFDYKAGQFAMLAMDGFMLRATPNALKWTSYSIASSPNQQGILEFVFKIKESNGFSQFVRDNLQLGMKLKIRGPFGNFVNEKSMPHLILVATGAGIAPIIGMIRFLLQNGSAPKTTLVYGFRNSNYFVYKEELEQYAKTNQNFTLVSTCSKPDSKWQGRKGYVQESLKDMRYDDPGNTQVFICGNPIMVSEVRRLMHEKGLPIGNLHIEQWEGA